MKKLMRILSLTLVLAMMLSLLAVSASAYEVNCGYNGGQFSRTYTVYHTFGTAAKICRMSQGVACDYLGTRYSTYGKFTYTVKNSSGTVIKSGTWRGDSASSATLVDSWRGTGRYTISVSATQFPNSACSYWTSYPRYKITW